MATRKGRGGRRARAQAGAGETGEGPESARGALASHRAGARYGEATARGPPPLDVMSNPNWAAGARAGDERFGRPVTLHAVLAARSRSATHDEMVAREKARRAAHYDAGKKERKQLRQAMEAARYDEGITVDGPGADSGKGAAGGGAAGGASAAPAGLAPRDDQLGSFRDPGDGGLRSFERWIVPELRTLTLQHNGLGHLEDSFGGFQSLVTVDLSHNKLMTIPDSICSLPELDTLLLQGNKIAALPQSITAMTNLTMLNLSANSLLLLPEKMGRLVCMRDLDLSGNRELRDLPNSIGLGCAEMRRLILADMAHLRLPSNITNLRKLEVLHVASQQILAAPQNVKSYVRRGVEGKLPGGTSVVLT